MELKIKNMDLVRVINFLDALDLGGLKGINRTKLSVKLQKDMQELFETEQKLRGELKNDKQKLKDDLITLQEDYTIIDGGDSRTMLESVKATIKEIIKDEETKFEGEDAYALLNLYEAFDLDAE